MLRETQCFRQLLEKFHYFGVKNIQRWKIGSSSLITRAVHFVKFLPFFFLLKNCHNYLFPPRSIMQVCLQMLWSSLASLNNHVIALSSGRSVREVTMKPVAATLWKAFAEEAIILYSQSLCLWSKPRHADPHINLFCLNDKTAWDFIVIVLF